MKKKIVTRIKIITFFIKNQTQLYTFLLYYVVPVWYTHLPSTLHYYSKCHRLDTCPVWCTIITLSWFKHALILQENFVVAKQEYNLLEKIK